MARTPRRLMKDPAKAGLSPEERHLLGAVDGSLSVDELAFIAGRSSLEVDTMLDRLEAKGLVSFGSAAPPPAPVGTAASTDDIQLSAEARARIDHYDELARLADHYRLLDLPRDATTDEIKKAYYRLAPKFHPDKYYGKRLGPFKTKIETIFASLTRAHDTLRYEKRRTAYDATLPPLRPGDRIRRREPSSGPPRDSNPDVVGRASQPGRGPDSHGRPSSPGRISNPGPPPSAQPRSPYPAPPESRGSIRSGESGVREQMPRRGGSTHPVAQRQPLHPRQTQPEQPRPGSPDSRQADPRQTQPRPSQPGHHRHTQPVVGEAPPSAFGSGSPSPFAPRSESPFARRPSPHDQARIDELRRQRHTEPLQEPRPPRPSQPRGPAAAPSQPGSREDDGRYAVPGRDPGRRRPSVAERDTLARKLGHRGPAPATRRPVPVTEVRQVTREVVETQPPAQSAAEIIRGRHAQLQDTAKRRRLARYLETGRVAMEAGDYRAAAAAYEQAARLSPDDEEIRQKASEASSLALLR